MIDSLGERNDLPTSPKVSKPSKDIDTAQRAEQIRLVRAEEQAHTESITDPEADITQTEEIHKLAEKHGFFGYKDQPELVLTFLKSQSHLLASSGLRLSELIKDNNFRSGLKGELAELISKQNEDKQTASDIESVNISEALNTRFKELQTSEDSVAAILQILKTEFADKMDVETSAVLDKYSTLLSPKVFDDPEELEAVETIFYTQSGAFTNASFTTFVQTIYDQSNTVISEESKQKIECTFNIPRHPITTGRELSKATSHVLDDGSFAHHSEKSALEFRPGVKTYMNPNGEAVLSLDSSSRPHPISIPPHILENGESIAELANYALIRQTVYDEMGQLTNLFGGGTETELDNPDENTIARANHFTRLLIGRKAPDSILTSDDLDDLRSSLKALRDPSRIGESASLLSLNELGVLDNGNLQWERLDTIGHILRENQFYRTFEMKKSGEAHRLLTTEIERRSPYENEPKTEMSASFRNGHKAGYADLLLFTRLIFALNRSLRLDKLISL